MADDAQRDLDEALPALEAATASLKNLSRNDVVEVKSLSNPPAGVKLVMEVRPESGLSFALLFGCSMLFWVMLCNKAEAAQSDCGRVLCRHVASCLMRSQRW